MVLWWPQAKPVAAPISKVDTSIAKPDPSSSTSTKRKRDITGDSGVAEPIKKRKKAESDADATEIQHKSKHVAIKKKDRKDNAISETTKEKPGGAKQANIDSDSDEVMKELEERYLKQKLGSSSSKAKEDQKKTPKPTLVEVIPIKPSTNEPANSIESSDKSDEDDEADFNPETLVHETVSGAAQNKTGKRRKVPYAPEGETKEQRDERTVFIGNLPPDVLKMKVVILYFLLLPKLTPVTVCSEGTQASSIVLRVLIQRTSNPNRIDTFSFCGLQKAHKPSRT